MEEKFILQHILFPCADLSHALIYRYGNLTYSLMGPDAAYFRIDSLTGRVTTAVEFTIAGKQMYEFNVSAVDYGGVTAVIQVQVRIIK